MERDTKQPTDIASDDTRESTSQEPRNKIRSLFTCGSPVMAKELDSGVDVMQGSFMEGGNSILGVFSWELLRAKLQWVAH